MNSINIPDLNLTAKGWSYELNKISSRYLFLGTMIAILLNPVFGLVDYLTMHERWMEFMLIRVGVCALLGSILFCRTFIDQSPGVAGLLIFSIIITQDAYFYSLADVENLPQLSLAYMADFVGASMILLWSPLIIAAFLGYFLIINLFFYMSNSAIPLQEFLVDGGLLVVAGALFSMAMIMFRYHSVKSMLNSKLELMRSNEWMAVQNEIIEEKSAELQKSNNRLKEFAYIVSHDLKAPLRGIRNIASWIREDCGNTINETGISHLQLMDKQILKMENLINAVLEYSKTGLSKSKAEWINLDELIRDVIDMVEIDNNTRFRIASEIPQIMGTRIVVSQVMQNLLSNSIKHNDKTIREINIKITEEREFYQFMIADNGPGIDEKDHERIFELFQTLKNSNTYDSTGIGLPVARKMVEEAGGNIWLESKPGNGSAFYFSLPKNLPEKSI